MKKIDDICYSREKEITMFTEQEKLEITIDGLRNGDIFMSEDGIPVDECGDPIFEDDQ
jgi:ribosome assembly protein YihI (activator of Der GTPase)